MSFDTGLGYNLFKLLTVKDKAKNPKCAKHLSPWPQQARQPAETGPWDAVSRMGYSFFKAS